MSNLDLEGLKYKVNMGKPMTEEEFKAMRQSEGLPMPQKVNTNTDKANTNTNTNDTPVYEAPTINPDMFRKMMANQLPKETYTREQKRNLQKKSKMKNNMKSKILDQPKK